MDCPHNLAINRQTRMLANLSLVGCYTTTVLSPSEHDRIMLESAKENLYNMAYFGLTEYQIESQYMFEHTFNLFFQNDFEQKNTVSENEEIEEEIHKTVLELNYLDVELYEYAKMLFWERLKLAYKEEKMLNRNKEDK